MLIPYGTDRPLKRPTVITYWLLMVNVAVFVAGSILERLAPQTFLQLYAHFWLDPNRILPWGFVTYQFLHAGFMHIAANMLFLFVFGPNVEDKLGRWWFLLFYLVGGAAAGGAHCLLERPVVVAEGYQLLAPVVGASGAIAAVTGAYIVFFPKTWIRVFSLLIIIGTFDIPAWMLISLAIAKDIIFHGLGASDGVALVAHIGGYFFGIATALVLLWAKLVAREPYDLFSLTRHAQRRRAFRELASGKHSPWLADAPNEQRRSVSKQEAADLEIAEARRRIVELISQSDLPEAGREYVRLLDRHVGVVMNREAQIELANHYMLTQQHQTAAVAYELFLKRFPNDRESPRIKLMIALVSARYLNDPIRAKQCLSELHVNTLDEQHRSLIEDLRKELG